MFDEIKKEIPAEDSTSEAEKMVLFNEIKKLKPKVIVETGTHRGLTTMYMATAVLENGVGHIWSADPFEWGQAGNFRKFKDHEQVISYFQIKGTELAEHVNNIDFMFIDGFHEKIEVLAEIDALFPKLKDGAVVYFHDTNGSNIHCDVPGAIEERNLNVEYIKTENGMARYVHNLKKINNDFSTNNNNKTRRAKGRS